MLSRNRIGTLTSTAALAQAFALRKRQRLMRHLAATGIALAMFAGTTLAAPQGAEVVRGDVSIRQHGHTTHIRASDGAIINYASFNISGREIVRFQQPSANSTVLNRILSATPTYINGQIYANGRVFFVNPSGVFFGPGSIVDAAQVYAAAGSISDRDFAAGRYNFTDLRGSVVNQGSIQAQAVALIGRSVANRGAISGLESSVILAAGESVYLRDTSGNGSGMMVQVSGGGEFNNDLKAPGIENTGTINTNGGRVSMMAGDMYSLAIRNTGSLAARDVNIQGGTNAQVRISGTINATDTRTGQTGGNVNITGGTVILDNANIDASGNAGGGVINVGGNFQGNGPLAHANNTLVSTDSVLRADALQSGAGGNVVVWSDLWTWFAGRISAQGFAQGGNAEVSSKGKLNFLLGNVSLLGAPGVNGTLLLDPGTLNLTVAAGTIEGTLPTITAANGGAVESVSYGAINTALLGASVALQATNIINFQSMAGGAFNFTNLIAGRSLTLTTTTAGVGNGIFFQTITDTVTGNGGDFLLGTPGAVTIGNFVLGAGNLSISGVSGAGSAPDTTVAAGAVSVGTLNATTGSLFVNGSGFTQGGIMTMGTGNIVINSGSAVTFNNNVASANLLAISASGGINLNTAAGGIVTSLGLLNTTSGNIVVGGGGWAFGTLASSNSAAGGLTTIANLVVGGLTIGSVTNAGFNGGAALTGITNSAGTVSVTNASAITVANAINATGSTLLLSSTGALTLNAAVNTGAAGLVRLTSTGGITQNAAGIITAASLGANNSVAGNIDLTTATNVTPSIALVNTFATGTVGYVNNGAISVDALGATGSFLGASGVSTAGDGNITLIAGLVGVTNHLTLTQNVNAGAGTVRLSSFRSILQTGGIITAGTLAAVNTGFAGDILLTSNNVVDNFSARMAVTNRQIQFVTTNALTIGSVNGVAGFFGGNPVVGVSMANGGQALIVSNGAGGPLTINQAISVPGGTVRLVSGQGITQGVDGGIAATTLGVVANGLVALNLATNTQNNITNFAARNAANGAAINIDNPAGDLVIGSVTAPATNGALFNGNATLDGVTTTANGSSQITTANGLFINQAINVGTGTLRISASTGITQDTLGGTTTPTITAGTLAAVNTVSGNVNLGALVNALGIIAIQNATVGGTITARSSTAMTVGTVAGNPANFNGGADVVGVLGNDGHTINLISGTGGVFNINQAINAHVGGAGTGGTVRLGSGGGITQAAAGIITAQNLGVLNSTAGNVNLSVAPNLVTNVSGSNTFLGGTFSLVSGSPITVTTLAGNPAFFNGGVDLVGLSTADGDVLLSQTAGATALTIAQALNAGTGTVRLSSLSGITQTGTGVITAGLVGALNTTAGEINLTLNNLIDGFAASNTFATGRIDLLSTRPLTVTTVATNPATFNAGADLVGITSTGAVVTLRSGAGGALTVNQAINTGGVSNVYLQSLGGITQAAAGIVTAGGLFFNNGTAGDVNLAVAPNVIGTVAGSNSTGFIRVNSTLDLVVGTGQDVNFIANAPLSGLVTLSSDVTILTDGNLDIQQVVQAPNAFVRILANGNVTQSATGIISAAVLGVVNRNAAAGAITLDQVNLIAGALGAPGRFAALNLNATAGAGTVFFRNSGAFEVGSIVAINNVWGTPVAPFTDLLGVNTAAGNSDITLISNTGGVGLTQSVNAGTGIVRISAGGLFNISDAINQNAAGTIIASGLGLVTTGLGNVTLNQPGNQIGTLAANLAGLNGVLQFSNDFTGTLDINTVALLAGFNGGNAVTGLTTNNGNITILTLVGGARPITVNQAIALGSGNLNITTNDLANASPITINAAITGTGTMDFHTQAAASPILVAGNVTGGLAMIFQTLLANSGITANNAISSTTGNIDFRTGGATSPIAINNSVSTTTGAILVTTTGATSGITVAAAPTSTTGVDATLRSTTGNVTIATAGATSPILLNHTGVVGDEGFLIFTGGMVTIATTSAGAGSPLDINGNVQGLNGVSFSTNDIITLGGVAGPRRLITSGNAASVIAFNAVLSLARDARIDAGSGRVIFRNLIDGTAAGRNLDVFSSFIPSFNANPNLIFPAILFGGNIGTVNRLGTLNLAGAGGAPRGAGQSSPYATIVFAPGFGGTPFDNSGVVPTNVALTPFTIRTTNLNMAQREKMLSFGDLTLDTTTASNLGDLTVIGALAIPTGTINFISRPGEQVRNNIGAIGSDGNSDVVANSVNFGQNPTVDGGANVQFLLTRVSTSTGTATVAGNPATIVGTNPSLITVANNFAVPNFLVAAPLDLVAIGGGGFADPSGQLPAVYQTIQRFDPPASISAGVRDFLAALKIRVRDIGPDELSDFLSGTAYYDDSASTRPGDNGMNSSEVGVSIRRISPIAADELRQAWEELAMRSVPVLDENGKPVLDADGKAVTQQRAEYIKAIFDGAFRDFAEQAGSSDTSPPVFESFLNTTPKHAAAKEALAEVRAFLLKLNDIGLTRQELVRPREQLLQILKPESIPDFKYFRELVIRDASQVALK